MTKEQIINKILATEKAYEANINDEVAADNLLELVFQYPQQARLLQKRKEEKRKGWATPYHPIDDTKLKEPVSLFALKKLLQEIGQSNKKVKAVGSGYAFSNVLDLSLIHI